MLTSIYCENANYWTIDKILQKEGDVEVEDIEDEEDDEGEEETDAEEVYKEKTPDLTEDIFREDDESLSIAECF